MPNTAPRVYSLQDSFDKHFLNTPCRGSAPGYRRKGNRHGGDRWPERKACWCVWEVIRRGLKNNCQLNSPSALRYQIHICFSKDCTVSLYSVSISFCFCDIQKIIFPTAALISSLATNDTDKVRFVMYIMLVTLTA